MKKIGLLILAFCLLGIGQTANAQDKPIAKVPSDYIGLKTRAVKGEKDPIKTLVYYMHYRVINERRLELLITFLKSAGKSYPLLSGIAPQPHGWEIDVRNNSPESDEQADKFVAEFGLLLGKRGKLYAIHENLELYNTFYVGPKPKTIASRTITSWGQNDFLFKMKPGDKAKLEELLEQDGIENILFLPKQNIALVGKANGWSWEEMIPIIERFLK